MKIAIMQPYYFPYLGYFSLVKAVDKFIFYDDVNFIKNGWINRNRIIINGKASYITNQLKEASPNKLINEIGIVDNREKLLKTIKLSYAKAPFFKSVYQLIENCITYKSHKISDISINTVTEISNYLNLKTEFEISSQNYSAIKNLDRTNRIIEICKLNNSNIYINAIGGQELYDFKFFREKGIELKFLKPKVTIYKQFNNDFIPWLSIIDVLMFNSREDIQLTLNNYDLI